jgi:Leucine-rich repeat (LRR) protein
VDRPGPEAYSAPRLTPRHKKTAAGKTLSAKVAATWNVELPARLVRFLDKERPRYEGRSIFGMRGFGGAVKMPLRFAAGELAGYADTARRLTGVAPSAFLPLAAAGKHAGTYFVAVELAKPGLPLHFFDYESGFALYAPDFETFLKRKLLKKGEPTPGERLSAAYKKAEALHAKEKFSAAEAILVQALPGVPEEPPSFDEFVDLPGQVMNLLGLCRERRGAIEAATRDFERGMRLGSHFAGLNICRRHFDRGDFASLIPLAERMRGEIHVQIAEYEWFWIRHYLGQAYLATAQAPRAVVAYHQIRKFLAGSEKHAEAAKDLRGLAKKGGPSGEGAAEILRWFDPPAKERSEVEHDRHRAFWRQVPPEARAALLGQAKAREPSDEALAAIVKLRDVRLTNMKLGDGDFLRGFELLESLNLEGSPIPNLAPLLGHARLEELDLRRGGITSLAPLAALPLLRDLSCGENPLESLDGLQALKRLRRLHAPKAGIRDLSPLAGLKELEELTLYENPIDDLSPLAGCASLKEISCFGAKRPLRGLPALARLPRLEEVNGDEAPKADVRALRKARPDVFVDSGDESEPRRATFSTAEPRAAWDRRRSVGPRWARMLEKMLDDEEGGVPSDERLLELFSERFVSVEKLGLKSLAPVAAFKAMDSLDASDNALDGLDALAGHPWLRDLSVRRNAIRSLAPLATLRRLEELHCDENPLASLAGLEKLRGLRELSADQTGIADLSPLRELKNLSCLAIVGNRVRSLKPLAGLDRLESLYAYENAFTDLSPLAGCARLRVVECFANPGLKNVLALKDLPELRQVVSHGALPAREIHDFSRLRPDVEID